MYLEIVKDMRNIIKIIFISKYYRSHKYCRITIYKEINIHPRTILDAINIIDPEMP